MRIIECGPAGGKPYKSRPPGSAGNSLIPFRRKRDAQETFISFLADALDNQFFLLNNLSLPGQGKVSPLLLCGPIGVWAVLPSGATGLFQVNERTWEQMDEKNRVFGPSKPNLVNEVCAWAAAISESLAGLQIATPPIEPVLFFSDPAAHVDSSRPAARIVLADGLPRFLAGLFQARPVLDKGGIQQIVIALAGEEALQPYYAGLDFRDDYSFREKRAPEKPVRQPVETPSRLAAMSREEPEIVRKVSRKVPFTRWQWLMLGLLVLTTIIILVGLVFVILTHA